MLYLGVDGGGTKTAFALIDESGNTVAEHQEKTCYHIEVGIHGAKEVLSQGVMATLRKANKNINDLSYAFFGLPAYGEDSKLTPVMDDLPSIVLLKHIYQCDNDMVNGWAAAFGCEDSINLISGTGSMAYGVKDGKTARCGGWGELFSDEGSAYWIGRKGLTAFSRMSDGRSERGPLYEIVKTALNTETDIDVSGLVHREWKGSRGKIAELSTLVAEAAACGDKEALSIFAEAGKQLAEIVDGTRQALKFNDGETVKISYSGGVFNSKDTIMIPFKEALEELSPSYSINEPIYSPVIGAALYARKLFKQSTR